MTRRARIGWMLLGYSLRFLVDAVFKPERSATPYTAAATRYPKYANGAMLGDWTHEREAEEAEVELDLGSD
jgi:hypothetical protein